MQMKFRLLWFLHRHRCKQNQKISDRIEHAGHKSTSGVASQSIPLLIQYFFCLFNKPVKTFQEGLNVTSWDKISRMSQFFHMELNIPVFRPHPVLQIGEN